MSDTPWKLRRIADDIGAANWPGYANSLRELADETERREEAELRDRVEAEMAALEVRSCSTCAHFQGDQPGGYDEPFGTCRRAPATAAKSAEEYAVAGDSMDWPDWTDGQWMLNAHPGLTAFTSDASSYASTLHVHPTHLCSMWEPAPW